MLLKRGPSARNVLESGFLVQLWFVLRLRRDKASATKFVSPFTYLISVVNSAIKAIRLVCCSDGRSMTDDITKVKGLWSVFTKK